MTRLGMGLALVIAVLAGAVWLQRRPLRQRFSSHVETREGSLVRLDAPAPQPLERRARAVVPGLHCVLVHAYDPTGTTDAEELEDRFWASDGLEAAFCEDHEGLLNHRIQITGIRTTGETIEQDCTNRACFDAVLPKSE